MNLPLLLPVAFKNPQANGDSDKIILAGDIGGTKANMLLSRFSADGLETIKETRYVSKDYTSFNDILTNFLEGQPHPGNICFSVAGPIVEGKVKFTNLHKLSRMSLIRPLVLPLKSRQKTISFLFFTGALLAVKERQDNVKNKIKIRISHIVLIRCF